MLKISRPSSIRWCHLLSLEQQECRKTALPGYVRMAPMFANVPNAVIVKLPQFYPDAKERVFLASCSLTNCDLKPVKVLSAQLLGSKCRPVRKATKGWSS
jgi:hypothetical protein